MEQVIEFSKMQALGNDYLYLNLFDEGLSKKLSGININQLAKEMSDRHFGCGSDGLVLIQPGQAAPVAMRMFNADGSESEMCGNALRCVARFAYEHRLVKEIEFQIETKAGLRRVEVILQNHRIQTIRAEMGVPQLQGTAIPSRLEAEEVLDHGFDILGQSFQASLVNMGNPHFVTFVEDVGSLYLERIGPPIENHSLFPRRINAEFVEVHNPHRAKQRTWERGAGETLACGTGACAVTVAGILTGRLKSPVNIGLLGGELLLEWAGKGHPVFLTGTAEFVYQGQYSVKTKAE